MEPLQPTVRQGVAQLKDFITKLVDIEEKEGELSRREAPRATAPDTRLLRPPAGGPAHTGSSSGPAHSFQVSSAPPCVSGPHLPLRLSGCIRGLLVMFAPLPAPWPCLLPPVPLEALPTACCPCLLCPRPCFSLVSRLTFCPPSLARQSWACSGR